MSTRTATSGSTQGVYTELRSRSAVDRRFGRRFPGVQRALPSSGGLGADGNPRRDWGGRPAFLAPDLLSLASWRLHLLGPDRDAPPWKREIEFRSWLARGDNGSAWLGTGAARPLGGWRRLGPGSKAALPGSHRAYRGSGSTEGDRAKDIAPTPAADPAQATALRSTASWRRGLKPICSSQCGRVRP